MKHLLCQYNYYARLRMNTNVLMYLFSEEFCPLINLENIFSFSKMEAISGYNDLITLCIQMSHFLSHVLSGT